MRWTVKSDQCRNSTRKPSVNVSFVQFAFSKSLSQIAAAGPPTQLGEAPFYRGRRNPKQGEHKSDCAGGGGGRPG